MPNYSSIVDKNVLILGLGVSGLAAAELAIRHGAQVKILDSDETPRLQGHASKAEKLGADVFLNWPGSEWLEPVDLAIVSPGIPRHSDLGQVTSNLQCPTISELEFGYRFCSCPIIGVTGTNGKTTTVELLVHCLTAAGKKVVAAGNIGMPLSDAVKGSASLDYIVAEVSSFQLELAATFTPISAAILNVAEDHLDRYHAWQEYLITKLRLIRHMRTPEKIILNYNLVHNDAVMKATTGMETGPVTFGASPHSTGATYHINGDGYAVHRSNSREIPLFPVNELRLKGQHNLENSLAALALIQSLDILHTNFVSELKSFSAGAHRQELIATHNGVQYVNDSKSTNPSAMLEALKTFGIVRNGSGNLILIAGGRNKGLDFMLVIPEIKKYVKEIYLIGENRDKLASLWSQYTPCIKLFSAIDTVVASAINSAIPGDVVLFSPGHASMDMFTNYEERGNIFRQAVKRRLGI